MESFSVPFSVKGAEHGAKLLLVGVLAGVLFYAINKYALTPAEEKLGLSNAA